MPQREIAGEKLRKPSARLFAKSNDRAIEQ